MLIGQQVRLRGVERSDLPVVVGWMNDPHNRAQIARSSPLSMAEEERWFEQLLKSTSDVVFVIETRPSARANAKTLGLCGLHKIDWKHRNASLGILLGDAADRGHGFGTDALRALVAHAVKDLGLHRVELEVFPDNAAALKSYERCGFVVDGVRRAAMWKDGAFRDLVLMSILAPDVLASSSSSTARPPAPSAPSKKKKAHS